MLRIQATIGLNTYYFASEALDYADRYWEPRISNAFQISREFNSADKTGNKIRTVDVSLDNRDGFFNSIYTADGLVNGKFVLYFNEGDNVVKTFTGRVNKINSFGDDISLTIREVGYEYLTRKFPDAQIAYDYYSTSGINESWNAIPIHFGTVNRYPCPWVNLFESHFIIGSGPIHSVKKIYFDKTVVYDSSTGKNGYKPTPESPEIKFRIFKGARAGQTDIVDGIESPYRGFAFIQLYKIVNSVEEPADPVNPDGEAVQIYVDIEGIQNEAGNGPERNPAQILYQCFTKPYTAEEGYGLAIPPADLDFSAAITECGIQGFKIDGSIDNTTEFGEWVDEILRCCRGQLYENNGKISVRIDAAAAAPSIHFDETGELGYNCIVDTWTEPERDAQTNRVRLSYSWNFENSNFNKKPSYNQESPLGDTHLQNPTHANRIQKWNTETLEYKLIKDDTTAHKLAQYYLNNIVKQLITTSLTTEVDIPNTVDAGTVVKVTSPKYGWNQKLFRITNISRAEENTEIKLKEYDASVFTFYNPGTGAETSNNQYSVYNIPAKPKLTSLAVVNEILADGSTQTRINVNFVAPTENSQLVALYYKPAGGTEADFKPLDTVLSSAGTMSAIWKGIESGNYNFRLVTISPVGIYSDLSIASGDKHYYGQPGSEGSVALTGDTIAPGKPSIDDFLLVQGAVTLHFDIPTGFPSDFSHFAVYRKLNGGSLLPLDMKYTGRLFTDTDVAGYVSRQYSIVAYDKSMNPSESSDLSVAMTPLKIATNDIQAGAITSETITSDAIYGKCFMTNCNVSSGVAGVIFDSAGIRAYSTTANTFNMDAMTGNVSMTGTITALAGNIGGFCADPTEGLYAGAAATRVQMKPGAGFWAGATAIGDAPFSVTQAGVLKSTSGTIGGFSIGTNILCSTPAAGCSVGMSACNTSGAVAFWAGCSTVGSAPFRVTNLGALTAISGTIGGWTLASASLSSTNAYLYSGAANTARLEMGTGATSAGINSANAGTDISFWAGSTFANRASAPFNVTAAGALTANCGKIANWFIKPNQLCAVAADGAIMAIGGNTGQPLIWLGAGSGSNHITIGECVHNGAWNPNKWGIVARFGAANLFQVHACCDGTSICAQIAGWNFNASQIYSTGCGLILCNTGAIQTGDFVTSNKGWKIDSVGNAEFNNICARGAIRTAVFIKDQISVIGGCTMIRPAVTLDCFGLSFAAGCCSLIYADKLDEFAVNDLIRIKDGLNDVWGRVVSKWCSDAYPTLDAMYVLYCSGSTGWVPTKGQAIVNYGSCLGCGGIMLNGQCPYIDLYTHAGLPWSALCSRVRIGNLKNWSANFACDTYGIAMGSALGQYMTYDSESGVLDIAGNINVKSTLPLVMPAGAVGEWVAKGSTNASIAVAGGVIDISGNSNHGQAFGGVAVVDSEVGRAFSFNGTDTRISTNIIPSALAAGAFTIRFMIKTAETDRAVLVGNYGYSGVGDSSFNLEIFNNGLLRFYGSWKTPTDQVVSATVFNTGEFIDLVFIFNGTDKFLVYKNGVLDKETTATIIGTPHATALQLGRDARTGATAFGGLMAHPKIYNRALTPEEVKTLYLLGKDTESGTITAERIKTGVMSSLNWGASAGSCFNMNDGTFTLGGCLAPKLSWNGTTLNVVGNITIAAGSSGIANFTDANIDNIADGSTYKRTTANEKTGAGRAYSGLDSSNRLITAVIPGTAVTPSTAGLFIGSTNMGYHNGTVWKTYMDNSGNFYLGGSAAGCGLAWNASTNCLTVCGCITSCAGTIGGWNITAGAISTADAPECGWISIGCWFPAYASGFSGSIFVGNGTYSSCGVISIGRCLLLASGFSDLYSGISITGKGNVQFFRATADRATGSNFCGLLAGWNFNAACLYSGNLILNSSGAITGNYSGDTSGWCIDAAGNAKFNNATVRGVICACGGGNIGGFTIGTSMLCSTPAAGCSVGMSACTTSGAIAFWAGCSTVASAPFRVTNTGALTACSGNIGQLCIDSCGLGYYVYVPGVNRTIMNLDLTRLYLEHNSTTYAGSILALCSFCSGTDASCAPIKVCMNGATTCFAFCTNGRIQVQGTVYPSDRNIKTDFQDINVLHKLRQLPITLWRFKDSKDYQIGPVAQDFNSIFKLNHDWQTNLTVGGLDGIALKAVKEVDENVQRLERDNAKIREKLQKLECEMAALREMIN